MSNNPNVNSQLDLEEINSSLFNSFSPEEELWVVGGSDAKSNQTMLLTDTFNPTGIPPTPDHDADVAFDLA